MQEKLEKYFVLLMLILLICRWNSTQIFLQTLKKKYEKFIILFGIVQGISLQSG